MGYESTTIQRFVFDSAWAHYRSLPRKRKKAMRSYVDILRKLAEASELNA